MRVEGPLFFASGYHLRNMLSRLAGHRCLVLDLRQVPFLDVTGAKLLDDAVGSLQRRGMYVVPAQPAGSVARRLRDLSRSESSALRACPVSPSIQDAMLHAASVIGRDDLCDRCAPRAVARAWSGR